MNEQNAGAGPSWNTDFKISCGLVRPIRLIYPNLEDHLEHYSRDLETREVKFRGSFTGTVGPFTLRFHMPALPVVQKVNFLLLQFGHCTEWLQGLVYSDIRR